MDQLVINPNIANCYYVMSDISKHSANTCCLVGMKKVKKPRGFPCGEQVERYITWYNIKFGMCAS